MNYEKFEYGCDFMIIDLVSLPASMTLCPMHVDGLQSQCKPCCCQWALCPQHDNLYLTIYQSDPKASLPFY